MQAKKTHALVKVELSTSCKGKPRRKPVWVMRYVLPSGKDSRKVLGPAWTRKGRPAKRIPERRRRAGEGGGLCRAALDGLR